MKPQLSISLVNTNNHDLLRACLDSLYSCDHGMTLEVILVDNASTDGSAEMVAARYPDVQLIINDHRQGFAANHNQAMRVSRGAFILVLNEDTIVKPGALLAMMEFLQDQTEVGAVGCRLENPDGSLQPSCYRFPTPIRSVFENLLLVAAFPNNRWFGDFRSWPHDEVRYVDFVVGAAIMIRRAVLDDPGYLDDHFFLYAEETDWCFRMRNANWKVAFVPDGTIVHYGGQSSVAMRDRQFCEFNRSQVKYFRKHYGPGGAGVQRTAMIAGSVIRIVAWTCIAAASTTRRDEARSTARIWARELSWWTGRGPHEGIAELAALSGPRAT